MARKDTTGNDLLPRPPRRHRFATFAARWAGRRDGRRRVEADEKGHRPYTRRLEARAHRGEAAVDDWLHTKVEPIDRRLAQLAEEIASGTRRRAVAKEEEEDCSPAMENTTNTHRIELARKRAQLRREQSATAERIRSGSRELADLLSVRRHVLETARGAVAAFEAYYRDLLSSYLDGYRRRCRKGALETPAHGEFLFWVNEDLPLLVAIIDPDAEALVEIGSKTFWKVATHST